MSSNFNTPPLGYSVPAEWNLTDEDRQYMTTQTWTMLLKGENDPDDYASLFEDELEAAQVSDADATAFFTSAIQLRRNQQDAWGEFPTSPLTQAFKELENIGVIGRENFSCCGTCGSSEIWDERDDSRQWRGYLYYHTQDTDNIFEDRETYVGYGAFLDAFYTEKEWKKIKKKNREETYDQLTRDLMVNEVFPILEKHGITVNWNQDLGTRILLGNVDYLTKI